eukprot:TRINITY_DN6822_c0_g1_i1.p1 TRINITY_DN6822_c0_g1~~TRINITY_DN6822_c0_g1_i1.p1  ORF type:complete len:990 (+),score=262.17 TRINITY_DN6822_c0_g1_i1:16-2985(+)
MANAESGGNAAKLRAIEKELLETHKCMNEVDISPETLNRLNGVMLNLIKQKRAVLEDIEAAKSEEVDDSAQDTKEEGEDEDKDKDEEEGEDEEEDKEVEEMSPGARIEVEAMSPRTRRDSIARNANILNRWRKEVQTASGKQNEKKVADTKANNASPTQAGDKQEEEKYKAEEADEDMEGEDDKDKEEENTEEGEENKSVEEEEDNDEEVDNIENENVEAEDVAKMEKSNQKNDLKTESEETLASTSPENDAVFKSVEIKKKNSDMVLNETAKPDNIKIKATDEKSEKMEALPSNETTNQKRVFPPGEVDKIKSTNSLINMPRTPEIHHARRYNPSSLSRSVSFSRVTLRELTSAQVPSQPITNRAKSKQSKIDPIILYTHPTHQILLIQQDDRKVCSLEFDGTEWRKSFLSNTRALEGNIAHITTEIRTGLILLSVFFVSMKRELFYCSRWLRIQTNIHRKTPTGSEIRSAPLQKWRSINLSEMIHTSPNVITNDLQIRVSGEVQVVERSTLRSMDRKRLCVFYRGEDQGVYQIESEDIQTLERLEKWTWLDIFNACDERKCAVGWLDSLSRTERRVVNAKVLVLQRFIRGTLSRREIKPLKVINEIIQTEVNYVQSLQIMVEIFLWPLKKSSDDVDQIFGNVEKLLLLHRKFKESLLDRFTDRDVLHSKGIADLFFTHAGQFKRAYSAYINNYSNAVTTLNKLTREDAEFKKAVARCENNPACEFQDLASFLILPVQRIMRYVMLLSQLQKKLAKAGLIENISGMRNGVDRALIKMETVATFVNESKRDFEAAAEAAQFCALIKHKGKKRSALTTSKKRRLLKHGKCMAKSGRVKSAADRYAFLFTDVFVITKEDRKTKPPSFSVLDIEQLNENITARVLPVDKGSGWRVDSDKKKYIFVARSEVEAQSWVAAVQAQVEKKKKKALEKSQGQKGKNQTSLLMKLSVRPARADLLSRKILLNNEVAGTATAALTKRDPAPSTDTKRKQ